MQVNKHESGVSKTSEADVEQLLAWHGALSPYPKEKKLKRPGESKTEVVVPVVRPLTVAGCGTYGWRVVAPRATAKYTS